MNFQEVSIVLPVFRCQSTLAELLARIEQVRKNCRSDFEILVVDDGNDDREYEEYLSLVNQYTNLHIHIFNNNLGQAHAIAYGLNKATKPCAVVMDADLEDPPEALPDFIEALSGEASIVFGQRRHRYHAKWRKLLTILYDTLVKLHPTYSLRKNLGAFSALDRNAIDSYLGHPLCGSLYLTALLQLPLASTRIKYSPENRRKGRSSYSLLKLISLTWKVFSAMLPGSKSPSVKRTVLQRPNEILSAKNGRTDSISMNSR